MFVLLVSGGTINIMKKGLLIVLAVLPSLMAAKCTFGGEPFESPKNYTPYKILSDNSSLGRLGYNNDYLDDYDNGVRTAILKITEYKNIKELKNTTSSCFAYNVKTSGIGFFLDMGADMTFYADGYVDVDIPDGYSSLEDHYYYQFDQDKAYELFEFVASYYEAHIHEGE